MTSPPYLPHIDLLLRSLRITRGRLQSKSKVAIDTELLRALLQALSDVQPFSDGFYAETYPDIARGRSEGRIPDLKLHMVQQGYLEGRIGAPPEVDEAYYLALYPDVQQAIAAGQVKDAADHYVQAGAAEGRVPRPALADEVNHWNRILRDERPSA